MNSQIAAIETELRSASTREQEIIRHINAHSPNLSEAEIKALDAEYHQCVARRRQCGSAINTLNGLDRKLNPTAKAALQAALAMSAEVSDKADSES